MASTYSTNLAIELIGTSDQAGTWGVTTNSNLGTLIEQAISGYVTQAVATGTDTTITIPNGATGVARNMFIELTGTGGALTNLIVPANKKLYFIYNNASGAVTVKVSGQTGVSVGVGEKKILVSNGTDIVEATSYLMSGAASATITNLSVTSANITTLTSSSGTVTNLLATTASFGSASISNADILSATITSATITGAGITSAAITTLTGTTVSYGSGSLTGLNVVSAQITKFTAGSSAISNLFASGAITTVGNISTSGNLSASGSITASSGSITQLTSTSATITTLKATSATIDNVSITSYTVTAATITSANITTLTGTTLGYASASVTTLTGTTIGAALSSTIRGISGAITTLTGTSADITTITGVTIGNTTSSTIRGASGNIAQLTATSMSVTTLTGTSATVTTIASTSATITGLSSTSANIATLTGTTLGYASASITTVTGATIGTTASATIRGVSGVIGQFNATSATITTLTGTSSTITTIASTSATITTLTGTTVGYGSASLTNMKAVSAVITSATVTGLAVTSANITTLTSASGTITNLLGTTLTISGSTFLATSTGNIGIGTTSPSSLRLTLEGNAGQLRLRNSTTRYRSDLAVNNAGTVEWNCYDDTGGVYMPMNLASSVITFETGSGGTATERARITSGGDFGIGTASPATKLQVNGGYISQSDGTVTTYMGSDGTGSLFGTVTNQYLRFITNNTERMRLDTSGNLGIGTASPTQKLEVAGAALLGLVNRAAAYTGGSTTPSVSGASYMEITNTSPTTITNFTGAAAGQVLFLKFNDTNTTINRSNAYLAGSANFTSTNRATLTLIYDGAAWYEVCRTTNNG